MFLNLKTHKFELNKTVLMSLFRKKFNLQHLNQRVLNAVIWNTTPLSHTLILTDRAKDTLIP